MTAQEIVALIVTFLQAFFASNPLAQEVEIVLPQIVTAFENARAGVAFSVTFPLTVDGKPGNTTFGWAPPAA